MSGTRTDRRPPARAATPAHSTTHHTTVSMTIQPNMDTQPRQFVKRRILTFRMRPNPASVATSDDPP